MAKKVQTGSRHALDVVLIELLGTLYRIILKCVPFGWI